MISCMNHTNTWKDQFENDVYYVENVTLMLDIKMAFALVRMVFGKERKTERGNGMKGSFMGYNRDGSSISSSEVPVQYYYEALKRLGYKIPEYEVSAI